MTDSTKAKKKFKMPHLLYIMLGLIVIMSLLTYVIPAGNFAMDANGKLDGNDFSYLGHQTPVNLWNAIMLSMDGLVGSGIIIFMVMMTGANIGVVLETGAIDDLLNWSTYKLKEKSTNVLIPIMFFLMSYLGAFGGSDALIAVVPIGLIVSKKLKLDNIVAMGVTLFATMIGFGTGPTKKIIPQMMMGIPIYSGFGVRFLSMNFFTIIGLIFLMRYINKIQKDPSKSIMGNTDWLYSTEEVVDDIKEAALPKRSILVLIVFIAQYICIVSYALIVRKKVYEFNLAFFMVTTILMGIISGMDGEKIATTFAKGIASMAFVGFVIGLARTVSLIMSQGNIMHTIVYVITRPLMNLNKGISSIGITAVISLINPIIPSATSKAAILIPIIQPITDTLGINPQLAVQAFQYGDGFTNLISPALGWTVGSCVIAKVDFDKWFKWALPKVIVFVLLGFVWMYVLTAMNWHGGIY